MIKWKNRLDGCSHWRFQLGMCDITGGLRLDGCLLFVSIYLHFLLALCFECSYPVWAFIA